MFRCSDNRRLKARNLEDLGIHVFRNLCNSKGVQNLESREFRYLKIRRKLDCLEDRALEDWKSAILNFRKLQNSEVPKLQN